jgi:hypothetical protein
MAQRPDRDLISEMNAMTRIPTAADLERLARQRC